jgi:hypothetical protein
MLTCFFSNGQNYLGHIPSKIKHTADSLIELTLGNQYFEKTTFDCEISQICITEHLILNACPTNKSKGKQMKKKKGRTELNPMFYVLKYHLTLNHNSKYDFEVRVDRNQDLREKIKLPDCRNTKACEIMVDSLMAIDIAIKSGLDKGFGVYNEGLIYDNDANSFQWMIKNHLTKGPDKGDLVYIDATTGLRLGDKDRKWIRSVVH